MSDLPDALLRPATLRDAAEAQRVLARRVVTTDDLGAVSLVGGADVSMAPRDPAALIYAALVCLDASDLRVRETASAAARAPIPYVPGYLGFREAPSLVAAYGALRAKPDLILVDGHGVSHPRGLGIASHLGVLLDVPTVGVAKSIFVGRVEGELGRARGSRAPLVWKGATLAVALRTKDGVQPVYVSAGHRVSLETAVAWVLRCHGGYRLPEPTRQAHNAANAARRGA